jgi:hypothetical protein
MSPTSPSPFPFFVPAQTPNVPTGPEPFFDFGPPGPVYITPWILQAWGGLPPFLNINDFSKTGENQDAIVGALNQVYSELDDRCANFLGGRANVEAYMSLLYGHDLIGHGTFHPALAAGRNVSVTNAITGGNGTNIPAGSAGAAITFNDAGAFFNSDYSTNNGRIAGNTDKARAFLWLHELGHGMNVLAQDLGNELAGRANNNLINDNCKDTLNKFK